jgi:hypothetical protein
MSTRNSDLSKIQNVRPTLHNKSPDSLGANSRQQPFAYAISLLEEHCLCWRLQQPTRATSTNKGVQANPSCGRYMALEISIDFLQYARFSWEMPI